MRKVIFRISVLTLMTSLMSCATIIHGSKQEIEFTSVPSGAKVTINDEDFGNTPTIVKLKRKGKVYGEKPKKKGYFVKMELEGYTPYEMEISRKVDGWFFGNFLVSLPAFFVDMSTGGMYKLTPKEVSRTMDEKK
ncbi:MAG: PEGA domain-containing protein [Flavobacteriales bacterium]|nr:PEGA domain-containing protein [Flavobacteriales bacterium]MCB9363272.1 PEGA domain-containing protein [Flavobacteriales bacterium]